MMEDPALPSPIAASDEGLRDGEQNFGFDEEPVFINKNPEKLNELRVGVKTNFLI